MNRLSITISIWSIFFCRLIRSNQNNPLATAFLRSDEQIMNSLSIKKSYLFDFIFSDQRRMAFRTNKFTLSRCELRAGGRPWHTRLRLLYAAENGRSAILLEHAIVWSGFQRRASDIIRRNRFCQRVQPLMQKAYSRWICTTSKKKGFVALLVHPKARLVPWDGLILKRRFESFEISDLHFFLPKGDNLGI